MVITVCGTQCVGKSTFINDFLENFKSFYCPKIDYRKIIEERGLSINRSGNIVSQEIIFNVLYNDILQYSTKNDDVILDRSILDNLVYSRWLYENKQIESKVTKQFIENIECWVERNINRYDKILFIPLENNEHIQVVESKNRDTDIEYRSQINQIFRKYIQQMNIDVLEIYGDRSNRVNIVKSFLNI